MKNLRLVVLPLIILLYSKFTFANNNGMMSTFGDDSFSGLNGVMETSYIDAEINQGEFNGIRTEIEPQNKIFSSGLNGIMDVLDPRTDSTIGHKIITKKIDTPPVQLQLFYPVNGFLVENNNTASLNTYLKAIQNNQVESITIIGYTDPSGPLIYNQTLSKKRAESVAKWLISHNVPSQKIQIIGGGIDADQNDFQQARRVDIVIYVK